MLGWRIGYLGATTRGVEPSADLIALGAMLCAISRGYSPFDGPDPSASRRAVNSWVCGDEAFLTAKGRPMSEFFAAHIDPTNGADLPEMGEALRTMVEASLHGGTFRREVDVVVPPDDGARTAAGILATVYSPI